MTISINLKALILKLVTNKKGHGGGAVGVGSCKSIKGGTPFYLVCENASYLTTMNIGLRLASMRMDSVLYDSCAILFSGLIPA